MTENQDSVEKERLVKLWEAYKVQEKEYSVALKKILAQEKSLHKMKKMEKNMHLLIEEKNREIMNLQLKTTGLQNDLDEMLPQLEQKESEIASAKVRYKKLYVITEELEEEVDEARDQLQARDDWFSKNFKNMEGFVKSLEERKTFLEQAGKGEPSTYGDGMGLNEPKEEKKTELKAKPLVPLESAVQDEPGMAMEKPRAIKLLCKLDTLNPTRAKALYDSGFTSIDKIKNASNEKLLEVAGFDELLIESLRIDLLE